MPFLSTIEELAEERCYCQLIKSTTDSGNNPRTLISNGNLGTRLALRGVASSPSKYPLLAITQSRNLGNST